MSEPTTALYVTISPSNSGTPSPYSSISSTPSPMFPPATEKREDLIAELSKLNISNGKPLPNPHRSTSIQSTSSFSSSPSPSDSGASTPSPTVSPGTKFKKLKPKKPKEKKMPRAAVTLPWQYYQQHFESPESQNLRRRLQKIAASSHTYGGTSQATITPQIVFPTPSSTVPITPPVDPQPVQSYPVSMPPVPSWYLVNGQLVCLSPQFIEWEHHQHQTTTESTTQSTSQSTVQSSVTTVYSTSVPSTPSGSYHYPMGYPPTPPPLPAQSSSSSAEDQKEKAVVTSSPSPTAGKIPYIPYPQDRGTGVVPSATSAPTTPNSTPPTQSVTPPVEVPYVQQVMHPGWAYPYGLVSSEHFFPATQPMVEYQTASPYHSPSNQTRRRQRPGVCLFIFHLPPETNDEELFQLFRPYGMVLSAKVIRDKTTFDSKGYGFVNMATSQDADNAIEKLNGHRYKTKYLKVSYKKKKAHGRNTHNNSKS